MYCKPNAEAIATRAAVKALCQTAETYGALRTSGAIDEGDSRDARDILIYRAVSIAGPNGGRDVWNAYVSGLKG